MDTYKVLSVLNPLGTPQRVVSFLAMRYLGGIEKFAIAGHREVRCYTVSRVLDNNGVVVVENVVLNHTYQDVEENMLFCAMTWGENTKKRGYHRVYIIVGSEGGDIKVLNSEDLTLVRNLDTTSDAFHYTGIKALCMSRQCNGLLLSASHELISLWSLNNFHHLRKVKVNHLLTAGFNIWDEYHIFSGHTDGFMVWYIGQEKRDVGWLNKRLKTGTLNQTLQRKELKSTDGVVMEMSNVGKLYSSVVALMQVPNQNARKLTKYGFKRDWKGKRLAGPRRFMIEDDGTTLLLDASEFEVGCEKFYAVGNDAECIKIYNKNLQLTADIHGDSGRMVYCAISRSSHVVVGINAEGRATVFVKNENEEI